MIDAALKLVIAAIYTNYTRLWMMRGWSRLIVSLPDLLARNLFSSSRRCRPAGLSIPVQRSNDVVCRVFAMFVNMVDRCI